MTKIIVPTYTLAASNKRHQAHVDAQKGKRIPLSTVVDFSAYVPTNRNGLEDFMQVFNNGIANGDLHSKRIHLKGEFAKRFGAKRSAFHKGTSRLEECNLEVLRTFAHNGEIMARGQLRDVRRLIPNLDLRGVSINGVNYRMRSGNHEVAAEKGTFTGITGLDTCPLTRTHYRKLVLQNDGRLIAEAVGKPGARGPSKPLDTSKLFQPLELRTLYNLPGGTGKGQKIGIVALGGGVSVQDAKDYASQVMGIKGKVNVKVVLIDGATNTPDPQGADIETVLDLDGSLGAYDATIYVVIAPNTDTGFAHAIAKLIDLGCNIITISWGSAEIGWTQQGIDAMHTEFARGAAKGVSIYAAAGDDLSTDRVTDGKVHGDYPSTDPFVMSMIGLWISKDGSVCKIWNNATSGSGGGVSDVFAQQDWEKFGRQVRSLNDSQIRHWAGGFSYPGDPETGFIVMYSGQKMGVGGTSAGGPASAGLTGCANEFYGKDLGFYEPFVRKNASSIMVPVTDGDNAPTDGQGYPALDLTTGRIDFTKLINELRAAA